MKEKEAKETTTKRPRRKRRGRWLNKSLAVYTSGEMPVIE
jgi:hypothetical protein